MRTIIFTFALLMAPIICAAAEEGEAADSRLVRVHLLDGVYSVSAPADWHLEVSGDDLTATFTNNRSGPTGTFVIAAPNPAAGDIGALTEMAANAIMLPYRNGEMMQERDDELDGFPAHTAWFVFNVGEVEFLGWVKSVDFSGIIVQAMALAKTDEFEDYMREAAPVLESLELNHRMIEENIDILREVGGRVVRELKRVTSAG